MIRSGRDIFDVGDVVRTGAGLVWIVSKHHHADCVDYETRPVDADIPPPPPDPWWKRALAWRPW